VKINDPAFLNVFETNVDIALQHRKFLGTQLALLLLVPQGILNGIAR